MAGEPSTRRISDDDAACIREKMNGVGAEIGQLRAALASYQSRVRRILVQLGDGGERGAGEGFP